MGVRLVFFFHLVNTHLEAILMSIYLLSMALNAALRAATQSISGKDFSRKRVLTPDTVMRLLISAEGGSLDKILHFAGIKATASALTQRRAQIPPELFRTVFTNIAMSLKSLTFHHGYDSPFNLPKIVV